MIRPFIPAANPGHPRLMLTGSLVFLILLLPFAGCKEAGSDSGRQESDTPEAATESGSAGREPFPLSGYWVSESYLDALKRHGSPRKAQAGSEEVLLLLPDSLNGTAELHFNFHEVLPDLQLRRTSDQTYTLGYEPGAEETTTYTLRTDGPDRLRLNKKTFRRAPVSMVNNQLLVLEPLLFAGMYQLENGNRVTFDEQGRVRGLGRFQTYRPRFDYLDEGLQVDQVGLGPDEGPLTWYGFTLKKGELTLYELDCKTYGENPRRCVEVTLGPVKYRMKRVDTVQ